MMHRKPGVTLESSAVYEERRGAGRSRVNDVEDALKKMLFSGGSLNRILLGATGTEYGFRV